jgi:hypothetical protein
MSVCPILSDLKNTCIVSTFHEDEMRETHEEPVEDSKAE